MFAKKLLAALLLTGGLSVGTAAPVQATTGTDTEAHVCVALDATNSVNDSLVPASVCGNNGSCSNRSC